MPTEFPNRCSSCTARTIRACRWARRNKSWRGYAAAAAKSGICRPRMKVTASARSRTGTPTTERSRSSSSRFTSSLEKVACGAFFRTSASFPLAKSVVFASCVAGKCKASGPILSERNAARDQAMFIGLALEALAKVRMRDGDQGKCALRHRLSLQVDHPEFRHDVHDVGTRRGDDVARGEFEDDAAATL